MALDAKRTLGLPWVITVSEPGNLGQVAVLLDAVDGLSLLTRAGPGLSVGETPAWPSGLEDDTGLAAFLLDNGELGVEERTGVAGGNVGIEVGVDIDTDNVDSAAENIAVLLNDVDGFGSGNLPTVANAPELTGNLPDVGSKLMGSAETVEDGLVTDNNDIDKVPLLPRLDGLNLLVGSGNTTGLDEDTENNLDTVLLASATDGLQAVALGRVETDRRETLAGNVGNVPVNVRARLAARVVIERRVSNGTEWLVTLWRAGCLRLGLRGLLLWWWLGGLGRSDRNDGSSDLDGGERAFQNIAGDIDNGDDLLVAVGSGQDGGDDRVGDLGWLRNDGGDWTNGVGAGGRADEGGLLNDGGDGSVNGLGGRNWADNGGLSLDDGGDTSNGVGSGRNVSRTGNADSLSLGNGDGGRGNGISSRCWADGHLNNWVLWDGIDGDDLDWGSGGSWLWDGSGGC